MSGGGLQGGPATALLSAALLVIGAAMVVRTVGAGGGAISVGVILGALFIAAGAARLWLAWRAR